MIMRYNVSIILMLVAALALPGCSFSRPATERRSFMLQAAPAGTSPAPLEAKLCVASLTVAPAWEGKGFVYRTGEQQFESDFYNEFFITPRAMLTERLQQWLLDRGLFRDIQLYGTPMKADFLLEGHVSGLYGDFRNPAAPEAVVEIRFTLTRRDEGSGRQRLMTKTFNERTPIAEPTADALAKAFDSCFVKIMARLEKELEVAVRNAG